jgi:hypothetical protein
MTKATTILAAALTALALGAPAQAVAAPSGTGSAQDTVNTLEDSGYQVILDKAGSGPLDICTVDSLRPGGGFDGAMNRVALEPVYLTARC